tara:strand:- start:758 stop:1540 length:783 start_codon:yes stop_codon:yes gene_type:complete
MSINYEKKFCIKYKSLETTVPIVKNKLSRNSFCIIKNIIDKKDINFMFKLFKKRFNSINEKRVSGPWKFKMKDFRRLDLGDSYKNSRFSRCITFCEWNNKNQKFYKTVNPIINIRNILSDVKKEDYFYKNLIPYKNKKKNDQIFCDFVRMLQYPTGGGFLAQHDDFDQNYPEKIVNAILTITSRRKKKNSKFSTYHRGGLYFIKNNKRFNVEDLMQSGDLIVFDQRIPHGVSSIDPHKKIFLNKLNGRISLAFSIGRFFK